MCCISRAWGISVPNKSSDAWTHCEGHGSYKTYLLEPCTPVRSSRYSYYQMHRADLVQWRSDREAAALIHSQATGAVLQYISITTGIVMCVRAMSPGSFHRLPNFRWGTILPVLRIVVTNRQRTNFYTIPTERPPLVGEVSANFCW
jgi:hypothetical protein